jgi:hypothetical protein
MKTYVWAGVMGLALGACADEGTPSETANATMSGTSPTSTSTTSDDETGDSNDDDDPPDTSGDEDPGSTSEDPDSDSSDSDPSAGSSSGGSETSGSGLGTIRGAVIRSAEPAAGNDGIGDIYVGLLAECAQDAATVGDAAVIMDADLSAPGATVMYEITSVPDGTFYVVAFMDDNGNAVDGNPDMGDIVTAEGLGPGCVEVTVAGAADVVAPMAVNLNFLYPF